MSAERWLQLMRGDKKAEAGELRFVVINGVGQAAVRSADDVMVIDVIASLTAPAQMAALVSGQAST